MFEDSLLESGGKYETRRGATTAASAVLQCILLGSAVLLPMIYTEALPHQKLLGPLLLPGPPPPAPRRGGPVPHHGSSEYHDGLLRMPPAIPQHPAHIEDDLSAAPPGIGVRWGVENSTGPADSNSTLVSVLTAHPLAPPPIHPPERLKISGGVTEGHLVRRVNPQYPVIARDGRIEGDVLLRATIGRDGSMQNLSVVSGHPFLASAALDAVRQWQYQPFLVSGQPVEVDTEIVVRFRLSRN